MLLIVSTSGHLYAQQSAFFGGLYAGVEGGAISYNTQITFDGVDDPAGRGGGGFGLFGGYNYVLDGFVIGAELHLNTATIPDPYTFDPARVGFADLDLRRGASYGVNLRAGYAVLPRLMLYGVTGLSGNRQSVRLDGMLLEQFEGGISTENYAAWQWGAGLEIALSAKVRLRFLFRTLSGPDMSIEDFGAAFDNVSLTFFDVEPEQQQIFTGLIYSFD